MERPREPADNPVKSLFLDAVVIGSPEARRAFLDRRCGRGTPFRAEVDSLLRHHDQMTADYLEQPAPDAERPTMPHDEAAGATPAGARIRHFGDYEILAEIARGGMGVVYKARQKSLNRLVAIKVILSGEFASPSDLQRFRNEAEMVAQLDDPHIVPVYQVGEHEGRPYLCMKLVQGGSLAQQLDGTPLPASRAVPLIETLARAIHLAHRRGLVHRDLKPANILRATDGEYLITDFGLAKRLDASEGLTQTDQVMGTPSYMAPEQAWGRTREISPAADIYALGVMLYEALTGRPPFRAATVQETLELVRSEEPAPPRLLNPRIDPDLETICLKCLEKAPDCRYASAEDLAEDLGRYRRGEPIVARSYNILSRITRTLQRGSRSEAELSAWSTKLILFAGIVFVGHVTTFALILTGQPAWMDWLCRALQLVLVVLVLGISRRNGWLPANAAERQLWSIWVGYLAAYGSTVLSSRLLIWSGILVRGESVPERWISLIQYPSSAILSGLAFFTMGSSYWGLYYVLGLAFFSLSFLMTLDLAWAPLEYGTLWAASLLAIGYRLRRLGEGGGE